MCYVRNVHTASHRGCAICVPAGTGCRGSAFRVLIGLLFQLAFSCSMWRCTPFPTSICCLSILFSEVSSKVFGPFFNQTVRSYCCVRRVLCIFWGAVRYQVCVWQRPSPSLCFVLPFSLSGSAEQFSILIKCNLQFSFSHFTSGVVSKKSSPRQRPPKFSPAIF